MKYERELHIAPCMRSHVLDKEGWCTVTSGSNDQVGLPPLGTLEEAEEALRLAREELRETIDSAASVYAAWSDGKCSDEALLVAFTAFYYTQAKVVTARARVTILRGEVLDSLLDVNLPDAMSM